MAATADTGKPQMVGLAKAGTAKDLDGTGAGEWTVSAASFEVGGRAKSMDCPWLETLFAKKGSEARDYSA